MHYATVQDLVSRFGEAELVRLSAEAGQLDGPVNTARVDLAIGDATALIDSYIRRRYDTPLSPVPPEITAACCDLIRYKLAHGEDKSPTEQMRDANKAAMRFLESLADGKAALSGSAVIAAASSFAKVADRPALFQPSREDGLY